MELQGSPVKALRAGKLDSAAVVRVGSGEGQALTWGCGRAGKLGHGDGGQLNWPSRVESLVSRTSVVDVALGDHHSVFLDHDGGIWTCGENKEGQCGHGTPIEVIAAQHRKAFYASLHPGSEPPSSSGRASSIGGGGKGWRPRDQQLSQHLKALMQPELPHQKLHSAGMVRFLERQQRQQAQQQLASGGGSGSASGGFGGGASIGPAGVVSFGAGSGSGGAVSSGSVASALGWGGIDFDSHLALSGMQPGQLHTPMRIGRDQHPLSSLLHKQEQEPGAMQVLGSSGLENEVVVGCAASRYFSLAVTANREVWTFGACYDGSLGSELSWSTSAQKVSGALAQLIADSGGAVAVAAGGTFCLALTTMGKVVVWGKVPGGALGPSDNVAATLPLAGAATQGQRITAGEVKGLPPIRHIAAGQSHALLSDGERVWAIGRLLDSAGKEASTARWTQPQEMLQMPTEGLRSIACGAHSSAVVTNDGRLYMWGRLLEFHHAESLIKRYAASHASELLVPEDVRWKWAGFGSDKPALVDGVTGVMGVALGGWHALALVD